MKKLLDIKINDKFGDYICVGSFFDTTSKATKYSMKCEKCNRVKDMLSSTIRLEKGITHKSCGKGLKTVDRKFYRHWEGLRNRTTNPNYSHYKDYGGRGINSEEFKYFIDFYDSMYESYKRAVKLYGEENTSLERINVDGNYCKDNCTWIPLQEQQGNQRKTLTCEVIFPDNTKLIIKNLRKFCREHSLDYNSCREILFRERISLYHKGYTFNKLQEM